jgi:hypothetical protein
MMEVIHRGFRTAGSQIGLSLIVVLRLLGRMVCPVPFSLPALRARLPFPLILRVVTLQLTQV